MAGIGMGHHRIRHIFITHFHPDHTADMVHFLFATRHPPILAGREPFIVTAPRGFRELLGHLNEAYGRWLELPAEVMAIDELDPRGTAHRDYGYLRVTSHPVRHTPHSLAYRIEDASGKRLVYSGDTGFSDEIVEIARGADLLVLECAFPDGAGDEAHLTPSLAGRVASLAGVKRLLLLHFYPEVLSTEIGLQCRRQYSEELVLGRDLLHLSL
jgi:ribonuclease BN (tRNA processing enzyme)